MTRSPGTASPTAAAHSGGKTRRRGEALESALLDAAWDELQDVGYAGLTIEAVADRAGTSRAVLYRRWRNRAELVIAAMRRHRPMLSGEIPDTGSLRDDVLAVLRRMSGRLAEIGPETIYGLIGDYFADADAVLPHSGRGAPDRRRGHDHHPQARRGPRRGHALMSPEGRDAAHRPVPQRALPRPYATARERARRDRRSGIPAPGAAVTSASGGLAFLLAGDVGERGEGLGGGVVAEHILAGPLAAIGIPAGRDHLGGGRGVVKRAAQPDL